MNTSKPFYGLANFSEGELVRVADLATLEKFLHTWKYHHKLEPRQLQHAGCIDTVKKVFMYHGGDILYELQHVPGLWHQQLLGAA